MYKSPSSTRLHKQWEILRRGYFPTCWAVLILGWVWCSCLWVLSTGICVLYGHSYGTIQETLPVCKPKSLPEKILVEAKLPRNKDPEWLVPEVSYFLPLMEERCLHHQQPGRPVKGKTADERQRETKKCTERTRTTSDLEKVMKPRLMLPLCTAGEAPVASDWRIAVILNTKYHSYELRGNWGSTIATFP